MATDPVIVLRAPPLPYYLGAGLAEYRAGEQHPNRKKLGFYDLLLVARGKLYIGENGREWELGAGETLLLLPDGEHYATRPCEEETSFYWVHFEFAGERAEEHREERPIQLAGQQPFANPYVIGIPKRSSVAAPDEAGELLRQLVELNASSRARAYWKEQSLLLELLAMLERGDEEERSQPAARLAERTEAYLKRHYREELTNEALAEALHFHPNYIVRCMKSRYERTPMEYLHDYRLEQAKRLLVTTGWPVARIAESVGFRHAPYFSSCFKSRFGLSPLRFRRRYLT